MPRVSSALDAATKLFEVQSSFDPWSSTRRFSIYVSDYAAAVIGPALANMIAERAPRTSLRLAQLPRADSLEVRTVDGAIMPAGTLANDLLRIDLLRDRWVAIVPSDEEPELKEVSLNVLRNRDLVGVYDYPRAVASAARRLRFIGIDPNVRLTLDSYLAAPFFARRRGAIVLVPQRIATTFESGLGVRVLPCPPMGDPFVEAFWWDPAHDFDPAHQWFRSVLRESAALLGDI